MGFDNGKMKVLLPDGLSYFRGLHRLFPDDMALTSKFIEKAPVLDHKTAAAPNTQHLEQICFGNAICLSELNGFH